VLKDDEGLKKKKKREVCEGKVKERKSVL